MLPVRKILALAATLTAAVAITPARADEAAEAFVAEALNKAEPYMASDDQQTFFDGVEMLVNEYADMKRVGRFTLGQYARRITPEQAAIFDPLFKEYATMIYQKGLEQYAGEKLKVTGSVDRSERDIIVNSKLVNPSPGVEGADSVIHWRVYRNRDGKMAVIDVGVDDIWLAIEQREEFTSVIANNGGPPAGIDALIANMRDKLAK